MKVAALFLILMMATTCLAAPRRAMLAGIYGQEQRYRLGKGKTIEGNKMEKMSSVKYAERKINNHHSIPRQYYNDKGGNYQGDGSDNSDSGTGQP
ncbi:hypothetical protein PanWU01x14_153340 [Parasponia andersonii]|uniref:Uncharacterized protein n=1 Tax=Parasponia andersonii TaxID=3476 RepID=A0A2P5CH57_PARAD|nr:hypothetical protein PanWU01x14_153340 [Parasponia andersonii]